MFQSVLDYTRELQKGTEATRAFLYKVRGGRRRLVNKISKSQEAVKGLNNPTKYVASLKPALIKEALTYSQDITLVRALEAIRESYEFNSTAYTKGLFEAIKKKETYTVDLRGSGWAIIPKVRMNLDKTAGRLNLWASGVKAVRRELGTKVPKKGSAKREKSALQASKAWAGIFERRAESAQWRTTINKRRDYSGALAAWWQLLDKGAIPMASDRGGYPTHKNKPSNFLDTAEKDANAHMRLIMEQQKTKYENLFGEYAAFINEAEIEIARLDALIGEIQINLEAVRSLENKLGPIMAYIDSNKLEKAVQLIREGLLTKGTVELTQSGSQKRVRKSVRSIAEQLY